MLEGLSSTGTGAILFGGITSQKESLEGDFERWQNDCIRLFSKRDKNGLRIVVIPGAIFQREIQWVRRRLLCTNVDCSKGTVHKVRGPFKAFGVPLYCSQRRTGTNKETRIQTFFSTGQEKRGFVAWANVYLQIEKAEIAPQISCQF